MANFAVGFDQVDVAACARRGVTVTNTPGVLDATTADLAFALLLAAQRRLVEGDRQVRGRRLAARLADAPLGTDVGGSTLGIVGLGRIGRAVARRARGFDMRVLYTRRNRLAAERGARSSASSSASSTTCSPRPTRSRCTCRSRAETVGLIDARRLALLRDGACLVNTARGDVVDEPALVRELVAGRISAGLDVFVARAAGAARACSACRTSS